MRPGTYTDRNGDLVKVTRTETGYRLKNLRTGVTTAIGGSK